MSMEQTGKIFVISGPSGVGKTTLVASVLPFLAQDYKFQRVITYTSRDQREGEMHLKDYFFVTPDEFQNKINEGFFIEWSNMYGAHYGSPAFYLEELKSGTSLFMILDIPGALYMAQHYNAVAIWIEPPSKNELQKRLATRGSENVSDQEFRLQLAQKELCDYDSLSRFSYKIVNVQLNQALHEFEMIVRNELSRQPSSCEEVKALI
jgi:guanylate kinase